MEKSGPEKLSGCTKKNWFFYISDFSLGHPKQRTQTTFIELYLCYLATNFPRHTDSVEKKNHSNWHLGILTFSQTQKWRSRLACIKTH